MLPDLTAALELPRLTNGSIRASAIRAMKRFGIDDREVCTVSGHKKAATLANYDPVPHISKRLKMAAAIGSSGLGMPVPDPKDAVPIPSTSGSERCFLVPAEDLVVFDIDSEIEVIAEEVTKADENVDENVGNVENVDDTVENSNEKEKQEQKLSEIDDDKENFSVLTQGKPASKSSSSNILSLLRREQTLAAQKNDLDIRRIALMEKLFNQHK